jgi:hypothetical protein
MTSATYFDVALLCSFGLAGAWALLFVTRSAKGALLFLIKWAIAFTVLNAIMATLSHFPGYGVVRDALVGALSRVVMGTTGGKPAWDVLKEEMRRLAQKHVADPRYANDL